MNKYVELLSSLECQVETIGKSNLNAFARSEKSITIISAKILELRTWVRVDGFQSEEEEIDFFREIKPRVFALLSFHTQVLDLETRESISTADELEFLMKDKLKELQSVLKENTQFISYYRSGATHLDKLYFTRNHEHKQVIVVNNCRNTDPEFSTSYCQVVAHVQAFSLFSEYVERKKNSSFPGFAVSNLRWTENKVALVELIYALQSSGAISDGRADVKEICRQFEMIFNFSAGDIYRTFLSIKLRKSDRTRFIDSLSTTLRQRLEASEA